MKSAPAIMVSSTFYDLRQIRADLASFISNELGYVALLSELPSFPIDPDLNTIENCRKRVERDADIFVLVIGGRYGSIDDKTEKSITNLEFLEARQRGLPIYAFVEKGILSILSIWKDNPSSDYSRVVDTPRLFEFVESIRSQDRVWTFPFETAGDITETLRRQLAFLFNDALQLRTKLTGSGLPAYVDGIGARALRILLEQPKLWEHRLYLQLWNDEVAKRDNRIREYRAGLTLGQTEHVSGDDASSWVQTRLHEIGMLVDSANTLMSESIQKALGPDGEPSSVEEIVWVATMIGQLLDGVIRWAVGVRCARLDPPYENIAKQLALIVDDIIGQLQRFPVDSLQEIEGALASVRTGDAPRKLELIMAIQLSNLEGFEREIDAVRKRL